ncbi:hypothetical protein GQX74_013558 [Glossina fuscipes]|nr:hypothetical protein GQX74_013558 [Glossina fuscipes]
MSNKNYRNNTATEGYWTILETVPYSLANAGTNVSTSTVSNVISSSTQHQHNGPTTIHMATHHPEQHQHQHQHHVTDANDPTNLIASANVVVEIPSESHHQQHQQISSAQTAQEFIKINTSRLEDKMLLRNVVQYETATSNQATATSMQSTTAATQATILINDGHSNKLINPKSLNEQDHDHEEQLLLQEVAAAAVAVAANNTHITETDDNTVPEIKVLHQDTINTNDIENEKFLAPNKRCKSNNTKPSEMASAGLQYVCNVCGKSYKIKGSLKRHKSYECGVAPTLPCPYCPHKCKYKSDLRKHISQKHAATVANSSSSSADSNAY